MADIDKTIEQIKYLKDQREHTSSADVGALMSIDSELKQLINNAIMPIIAELEEVTMQRNASDSTMYEYSALITKLEAELTKANDRIAELGKMQMPVRTESMIASLIEDGKLKSGVVPYYWQELLDDMKKLRLLEQTNDRR